MPPFQQLPRLARQLQRDRGYSRSASTSGFAKYTVKTTINSWSQACRRSRWVIMYRSFFIWTLNIVMDSARRFIAMALLKAYKFTLSPVFEVFGAKCRHYPSCSIYGAESVSRFGVWPGGWMTLARLSRCRPGGSSGYDPVPDKIPDAPFWAPWKFGDWALTERPFPDQGRSKE